MSVSVSTALLPIRNRRSSIIFFSNFSFAFCSSCFCFCLASARSCFTCHILSWMSSSVGSAPPLLLALRAAMHSCLRALFFSSSSRRLASFCSARLAASAAQALSICFWLGFLPSCFFSLATILSLASASRLASFSAFSRSFCASASLRAISLCALSSSLFLILSSCCCCDSSFLACFSCSFSCRLASRSCCFSSFSRCFWSLSSLQYWQTTYSTFLAS
mmetsp:Transcript_12317/g.23617  ORF Transcript_12317/g.23617 Transcript_12317/m.23617 type:complete len:219 (-) Transcript_12317:524-1180(-)